jgi:glyoxylase-like metal-dependent hydrolase (beta-lactamase superfamily II)
MTLSGTNTYVVADTAGHVAVIDPGPDDPRHLEAIAQAAESLGRVTAVLVTHRHLDHLPAAQPVCERTGATLSGHAALPGVQKHLADGDVAFGALRALETPGHTRESLCFWDPDEGALFTGDLVVGMGTVIVDDEPGGLSQYMASLDRLIGLRPRTIYPGHGPIVEDAVGKLTEYREHRRQRERQIVDVLATRGAASVEELVLAIYTDVPANLAAMAARNVRAHLDKLASEGAAFATAGDRWQLSR